MVPPLGQSALTKPILPNSTSCDFSTNAICFPKRYCQYRGQPWMLLVENVVWSGRAVFNLLWLSHDIAFETKARKNKLPKKNKCIGQTLSYLLLLSEVEHNNITTDIFATAPQSKCNCQWGHRGHIGFRQFNKRDIFKNPPNNTLKEGH